MPPRSPARLIAFDADVADASACPTLARLLHAGVIVVAIGRGQEGATAAKLSATMRGPWSSSLVPRADLGSIASVARERGIEPSEVLVLTSAATDAGAMEVRVLEPQGVLAALRAEAALHPVELPARFERDPGWELVEDGFVLAREHEIESLFALGNGYVGTRASLAEGTSLSAPATFVAGIYDRADRPGATPELLRLPDWAGVAGSVDGARISLARGTVLSHQRVLDLRAGMAWREWRHRDPEGRVTRIRGIRLASQADRHVLLQSVTLTPEDYDARLEVESMLSGTHVLRAQSGGEVALHIASSLETPELLARARPDAASEPGARESLAFDVEAGRTYRLDRVVSVFTSRDAADPAAAAREHLERALEARGVDGLVEDHRRAWAALWDEADVVLDGDEDAQTAIRVAIYHLSSAVHPQDEDVSIGARGLTGTGYAGHVFWDTEIYMLPFLTLTRPEAARSVLMYRHRTLDAARERARERGWAGALYAWESADTGEDVTPPFVLAPSGELLPVHAGEQEQHISADVAYGVWSYWHATRDDRFLIDAGAEILIETARFWASRVEPGDDGRYHIRGVMGPDEYHASVDDDAYTNVMAQWNLERAAECVADLRRRAPQVLDALAVREDEPRAWLDVAAKMYVGLDPRTGVIEQFRGYFDLEPIDLSAYETRHAAIDLLLGPERVQRSQVIKQPDVVMLLHLLEERFPPAVREASFRFYDPRTAHGSSLSPPVHACVAARLGDVELATRYFRQTAEIDLANNMGNAAAGVHMAALGGLWQAAVFGFAGLRLDGAPRLEPHLPPSWRMRFGVRWRGERVPFELGDDQSQGEVER